MDTTDFTYDINSLITMEGILSDFVVSPCFSINYAYFFRTDTNIEVDFITQRTTQNGSKVFSLMTEDLDQTLRGNTIEFSVLVDLSNGQTLVDTGVRFSVEFVEFLEEDVSCALTMDCSILPNSPNSLPFFDPVLT